ncbi:MAG: phosphatidylglycerophosphatase A [Planctomycetes bacterium]|nr:phosphatidylglycerophosphatase A [Planctomycetota bacterium]
MNTHKLLTSSFGLGLVPVVPGTCGSLAPAVIYMAAGILIGPQTAMGAMVVLLVLGCMITVICSPKVIAATGDKDPGQIVSDEVAGQALTLLLAQWLIPMTGFCTPTAIGFGLFRLFDITKPWPCRQLEKLPAGWGILADDLAAGIWAVAVWRILIYPLV